MEKGVCKVVTKETHRKYHEQLNIRVTIHDCICHFILGEKDDEAD